MNCTSSPRQRLLYDTPFRVHDKYTLTRTFTRHHLSKYSNFLSLKCEDNVCKRLYVSRPLLCRLRLADGDDTTMSGEDMRRAAHQLRCKDTLFLWESSDSAIEFSSLSYLLCDRSKPLRGGQERPRTVRETFHQIAMIMSFQYNTGERTTMFRGQSDLIQIYFTPI